MIKKISQSNFCPAPLGQAIKKLPDKMYWYKKCQYGYHDFVMFTTQNPNNICRMSCKKSKRYNIDNKPSLFITMIISEPRKKGLGSEMLKVAHNFSKELGCEGRYHLCADPQFTMEEVPHIFYRKQGLSTDNKNLNQKLDNYILNRKSATIKEFKRTMMYYPALDNSETPIIKRKTNVFTRFINSIRHLLD